MSEIEKVIQDADFVVNGYSFDCKSDTVRILNLNDMSKATVLSKSGDVLETSMDDIEISIVLAYWNKNKQFAEG